ncbi:MAG: hypothetical protein OXG43_12545 [Chloroflexi bacterium]|nr:hypothetical protein [Chloroflexota bacterium]
MRRLRWRLGAVLFAVLIFGMLAPALAAGTSATISHGTVVGLQGTPHLWIADAEGVLHWGGDTRALAGRTINWDDRVEVSVEQLQDLERGDPWLSLGLVKDGDPIYLPKWETDWAEPQLFHIQSIADVELFGINSDNYGDFVLDRSAWESEYGFSVDDLQTSPLPPATSNPATQDGQSAVMSGQTRQDDDDDDEDDDDDNTGTATATATDTATGDQTATATATATDDGTSITSTATNSTDLVGTATNTATATATATATGDLTATATATATDDGTSITNTSTDDTDLTPTATLTATDTSS